MATSTRGPELTRPRRWVQPSIVAALVLAGLAVIFAVPWLRHSFLLCLHGNFAGLRTYVRSLGASGLALLVGLMVMHALVYYPTELVTATTAFIYGWPAGMAIALVGWLLSALASFLLGRLFAGPLLRALLGRRYVDFERAIQRGGIGLLLSYRLVPIVPFSFIGYAAGAVGTDVRTFAWTTLVGYLPLTAAVTYLGSRAQSLSLGDPLVWVAVALLLCLLAAAHQVQRRFARARVGN
jgi:uncharacterized membrane protein YdjX (TVP38/TMEM64 family)